MWLTVRGTGGLLAAAGLVRERIVLSGDLREVTAGGAWNLTDGVLTAG